MPAAASASISSAPRANRMGSPPFSRATVFPDSASATTGEADATSTFAQSGVAGSAQSPALLVVQIFCSNRLPK